MVSSILLAAFTLVGADKSAKVVIPENAEPSTRLCAEELTNYVAKISGEILKVEKVGGGGQWNCKDSLIIGTLTTLGEAAPAVAREALAKSKYYDSAWMGTVDGNLWIVGKEATGDLYAMYHFLETKLGVRWFQAAIPEDSGDYYPTVKVEKAGGGGESGGLVIQDFQEFREPAFKYRQLCMNSAYWNVIAKPGITCAIRNGYTFNGKFFWLGKDQSKLNATEREFKEYYEPRSSLHQFSAGGGHGIFFEAFPKDKYFPLHPEWFPLINGKRQPSHGQCCQSNTNLLQAIVDKALAKFALTGGKGSFSIGNTDNIHGWCECDACKALDGPDEDPYGSSPNIASRICFITSYIAPRIWAKYPKAVVTTFPYSCYRALPQKGTYDKRHECQYCTHGRCYGHPLDDPNCTRNVQVFADMKKWLKIQPKMWTFEYFTDTPPMYVCHERDEQRDLQLFKKLGFIGWFNEGAMTGSRFVDWVGKDIGEMQPSNWQWLYATGHLLWNPYLDLDALLEDAETKYYGVAAKPMHAYHNLRRKLWNNRHECMGYPSGDQRRPLLLNADGAKEQLLAYLDEAEKLVDAAAASQPVDAVAASQPVDAVAASQLVDAVAASQLVDAVAHRVTKKGDSSSEGRGEASASTGRGEPPRLQNSNSILKFRISRDRKWLTNYWIKPNEKARKMASNALKVPMATSPVKIDGDGSDAAWCAALYPNHLFRKMSDGEAGRGDVPPELKTSVGMLTDGTNLYFLVKADEPHPEKIKAAATQHDGPAWGDDGVEIMIFSPSVENCYYHIAVNTKGVVYDARCPGNDTSYDLGVEAKGKVEKTGGGGQWMLEVRVPTSKIYPLIEGDKWRIQVVRNSHAGSVSFGGALPHMTEEYPSFEFGESLVVNGGFDDVDEKTGKPTGWMVNSGEVRREGANNYLFTKAFSCRGVRMDPLGPADRPRKIRFSFRAKGKGEVSCEFVRYADPKRAGTYMPEPRGFGGVHQLTNAWTTYTGTYTVEPYERVSISFYKSGEEFCLDDVNVTKE